MEDEASVALKVVTLERPYEHCTVVYVFSIPILKRRDTKIVGTHNLFCTQALVLRAYYDGNLFGVFVGGRIIIIIHQSALSSSC
jgi:hypothetical protein